MRGERRGRGGGSRGEVGGGEQFPLFGESTLPSPGIGAVY